MGFREMIEAKQEWRTLVARVKTLPQDYRIVYAEIQRYYTKVGPAELNEGMDLLSGIVDLFCEGAAAGKGVLDVTGPDVAAFCDTLIKDSKTYADTYQEYADREVKKAMEGVLKKTDSMGRNP